MKRFTVCIATAMLLLTVMPVSFAAERPPVTAPAPKPLEPAEAQVLINRLNEIKEMDKRDMSAQEKKELKEEKTAIKSALRGGGVYLSIGALLVVIILLVLLL